MIAREVMSSPVWTVPSGGTIAHARKLMVKHRISRLLVMDGEELAGILTKKDIAFRLREQEPAWRRRPIDRIPVEAFATKDLHTVGPDTPVREIARLFISGDISSVPVVDNGAALGIVTKTDLMKSPLFGRSTLPVRNVMEDAVVLNRYHSLDHVIDIMTEKNDKLVVVNNDGTLAGVITETNLAFLDPFSRRPGKEEKDVVFLRKEEHAGNKLYRYVVRATVIAEDVMSHPAVTIGPDASVSEAVAAMREYHVNSLVVVEKDEILGIIKRDDIILEVTK
ncbi:MAG TPA: CBS domain-containing protein [Methanoregula sp.]|nr:CBS domain-containing protein [Methanoregula sp.]